MTTEWNWLVEAVEREMRRQALSPADLSRRSGLTASTISRFLMGERKPRATTIERLLRGLGFHSVAALAAGVPSTNVLGVLDDLRPPGTRPLPVYRWGAAGNPWSGADAPVEDHLEYPPLGKEALIGPRGIGVVVRGDSMAGWGLHDGDTAWCVPTDQRVPRPHNAVLARVQQPGGEMGMVIKQLRQDEHGKDVLWSYGLNPGDRRLAYRHGEFEVMGVVVWVTAPGHPPERRLE